MKTALRIAAIVAVPLTLAACNETSNGGYANRGGGGGGLFGGSGGLFGNSGGDYDEGYGNRGRYGSRGGGGPYAYNGRCDDPSYNTSNGGRAERGSDEFDCSRYGQGLKR